MGLNFNRSLIRISFLIVGWGGGGGGGGGGESPMNKFV